ncbi:hypothetical protein DW027_10475 [Bacteroides xylanisolvens]|uniref:Uncharacterized protein n=1 Tax=Bacteroides xylanisolvens TaxID=371601 RepID=A0A415KPB5_9BACE|nr:hypothetical protein DW027_10475 [Bacteroides xylanisolvens]
MNLYGEQELIMDLGEEQEVRIVFTRWMQLRAGARRHLPQQVEILFSNDGGELFFRRDCSKEKLERYSGITVSGVCF